MRICCYKGLILITGATRRRYHIAAKAAPHSVSRSKNGPEPRSQVDGQLLTSQRIRRTLALLHERLLQASFTSGRMDYGAASNHSGS